MLIIHPFRQDIGRCGPACLKMVLQYFGMDKTEEELTKLTKCTSELGATAEDIAAAAKTLGFKASVKDFGELKEIDELVNKQQIPVIVDWFYEDDGHYSVVIGIDSENIYIQDPSFGHRRALRLDTFFRCWFDFEGDYIKSKDDMIIRRLIVIRPK